MREIYNYFWSTYVNNISHMSMVGKAKAAKVEVRIPRLMLISDKFIKSTFESEKNFEDNAEYLAKIVSDYENKTGMRPILFVMKGRN